MDNESRPIDLLLYPSGGSGRVAFLPASTKRVHRASRTPARRWRRRRGALSPSGESRFEQVAETLAPEVGEHGGEEHPNLGAARSGGVGFRRADMERDQVQVR